MYYDKADCLKLLPKMVVHFDETSLANIVSMAKITNHYRVTIYSSVDDSIFVHVDDETLRFKRCGDGIYYIDLSLYGKDKSRTTVTDYSRGCYFLSTVKANKEYYTRTETD